ncbi:DUF481 domain-containing protein [Mucilaginibacter limnophilus]|uniref:DUF481 domain-containing protein n=2 Tax=Mucilaginibacter limnophilus TaxID=1932778 RepID=A0A437MSW4_9SPHI|nr:DUF481 domain-containing protein [Mucilaginibacter limnophilus]
MISGMWLHGFSQFTDSTHYRATYQSSGSINRTRDGNTYLLNNAFRFGVKKKDMLLNFNNSWIYGRQQDALTNNDFSTSLDFNLYQTPKFYYWGLANYNTSYSLKVNNQLLAGVGLAYNILDKENAYLNVSDGVLYDKSDLFLNDTTRDVYHTYRNSARLAFRFTIYKVITIESSTFLQNSFDYGYDYIIRSTNSLSFKLNPWLSLTTALAYNRQNRTNSENLLFTYGLTLEKYF